MLSSYIFNDVSNDFWRKVLKPSLPHAIVFRILPEVFQELWRLFSFDWRMAFVYDRVAVTSRVAGVI